MLASLLAGSALAATPQPVAPDTTAFTLDNGLRVLLAPAPGSGRAAVDVTVEVGDREDPAGFGEVAHLVEHLVFGGGFLGAVEMLGGHANATTDTDFTRFFAEVPSAALPRLLSLDAARLAGLPVAPEVLAVEKDVVAAELRGRYQDAPEPLAWLALDSMLAGGGAGHRPLEQRLAGLERVGPAEVEAFWAGYYAPGRVSLAVGGDFDPAALRPVIEQTFGAIPSRVPLQRVPDVHRPAAPSVTWIQADVATPQVLVGWPTAGLTSAEAATLDLAARVLLEEAGGELRDAFAPPWEGYLPLVTGASAEQLSHLAGGLFVVTLDCSPGTTPAEVLDAMWLQLAYLRPRLPPRHALDVAREQLLHDAWVELGRPLGLARSANLGQLVDGGVPHAAAQAERWAAVGAMDHARLLRKVLTRKRASVVVIARERPALDLGGR